MGIAVLLCGGDGDRYAVLHAVALAQRTGEKVHGILSASESLAVKSAAGQRLLLQLADEASVPVRCHALEGKNWKNLLPLFKELRIFCLIVGAEDKAKSRRAEKRLETLRRHIAADPRWTLRSFWAMVSGPWSNEDAAATLKEHTEVLRADGLEKTKGSG